MQMKANQQNLYGFGCFFPEIMLDLKKCFRRIDLFDLFFEFWITLEIIISGVVLFSSTNIFSEIVLYSERKNKNKY